MSETEQRKRRICLFSDGTGNSSGKLNKTNVWRMYEAIDFGIPEDCSTTMQIGRYDDGIGTSSLRPLALIQGAFGFGLAKNVRALYLFLCQNYRPRDEVALFGFSRGAFTVRVLADLIDQQGILSADNGEELPGLVAEAYRRYRRNIAPPMPPMRFIVQAFKAFQAGFHRAIRRWRGTPFEDAPKHAGTVSFLGAWDTVDAYGGPVIELIRAIDQWIARISFRSARLPDCVKVARHALALDEERDAFRPIPWDEQHGTSRDRLLQVWFAGVHSDVGGGYPEQGLAYVSLCWMMEHALDKGIRLKPTMVRQALDARDASGRMHDSRAGLGGYYRYQPRNVGAYIRPAEPGTQSDIGLDQSDEEGMRTPILIHESVFQRMVFGTDRYAPISIAGNFEIVSDRLSLIDNNLVSLRGRSQILPDGQYRAFSDRAIQRGYMAARPAILDKVWRRRVAYFVLAGASVTLLAMPLWDEWILVERGGGLFRAMALPFATVSSFVPSLLAPWFDVAARRPVVTWAMLLVIAVALAWGARVERQLRGQARALWNTIMAGRSPIAEPGGLIRTARTSPIYQGLFLGLKWAALPSILGVAMVGTILGSAFAASVGLFAQARISLTHNPRLDCRAGPDDLPPSTIDARQSCTVLPTMVEAGRTYTLMLAFPRPAGWPEPGSIPMRASVGAGRLAPYGYDLLAIGTRRAIDSGWLEPLIYVRQRKPTAPGPKPAVWEATQVVPTALHYAGRSAGHVFYSGTFRPDYSGMLGLGLNDAVAPWPFVADAAFRTRFLHHGGNYVVLADARASVGLWVDNGGSRGTAERLLGDPVIDAWTGAGAIP